jgi:hypothetical protein
MPRILYKAPLVSSFHGYASNSIACLVIIVLETWDPSDFQVWFPYSKQPTYGNIKSTVGDTLQSQTVIITTNEVLCQISGGSVVLISSSREYSASAAALKW